MTRTPTVTQVAQFRRRVVMEALKTGNISNTARQHRITRQTLHRWMRRFDGTLDSLKDRSKRPRSHPHQHTPDEIQTVKHYYKHNRRLGLVCLWVKLTQQAGYNRSLSALYRLLRRLELIAPPRKRPRRKPKPYEPILTPGERFQIDVKYVPRDCLVGEVSNQRLYQFTAIDECTRWRYAAIFTELSTYNAVKFVQDLQKRFPFEIQCIQTDNGAEFTSRFQGAKSPSAFENYLALQGIRHKTIAVATPRHNGKVERSHRFDQERFYQGNTFYNISYLKQQFQRHIQNSNQRPLLAHNWKSAAHILEKYCHVL